MLFAEAVAVVENPDKPGSVPSVVVVQALSERKAACVANGDQRGAKAIWCIEQAFKVQGHYMESFRLLKEQDYYAAWCQLERAEVESGFLCRHRTALALDAQLAFIDSAVKQFQSLFPYRIFMSPEIRKIEQRCTVCNSVISPRRDCGHRVGEIYDGEMCGRIVTKAQMLGSAMVKDPVQKYSVGFLVDPTTGKQIDQYNYSLVEFAVRHLNSPWESWSVEKQKRRHPHSRFRRHPKNRECPCGSGRKYKGCCKTHPDGVLQDHFHFEFPHLVSEGGDGQYVLQYAKVPS